MKTIGRLAVVTLILATIIGFTSSSFAALRQPQFMVGTPDHKLSLSQGERIHQLVKLPDGNFEAQTINAMDPGVPRLTGKLSLEMNYVLGILLNRNRLYVLGGYNASRYIKVLYVGNNEPRAVNTVPVANDAKAMALVRDWLGVISDTKLQFFDLDKPEQPKPCEMHVDQAGGFTAIVMKDSSAYVLSHTAGQPSRIINFRIDDGKAKRMASVPVNPYATELYLFDEFNDGVILAMGTEEPRVYESYYRSKPKLEVKSYFDAYAVTFDRGNLRSISAPSLSGKEMIVAVSNGDGSSRSLYLAAQNYSWDQRQGQFVSRPIIKKFEVSGRGFRQTFASPTAVTYPMFLQETGDGVNVFGQDFDNQPLVEIFKTR